MTRVRPTRIVHVPRRFVASEWGGTETVILETSRQQQFAGWEPVIHTSKALSEVAEEQIGGVSVRRYPYCYPFFGLSPKQKAAMDKKGGNLLSFALLWGLLREKQVRLFHAHALKRLGAEVRTAARLRKKPYVVTLHGGVFDVPAAELSSMLEPISGKVEWGRPFGALLGSRRVLEDADHVLCVGESERRKAAQALGHDRITHLPNGVDTARFASGDRDGFRQRHGMDPDHFLVLNLSRIDSQKNQLLLVEGFEHFYKRFPKARLLLIGPETQPDYAAKLRLAIQERGMSDCIRLLPGLANGSPDLVNAYHAADVFVLPSMHEPFGIVVLEAWSAGKPVIVSRVGGLQDLVEDGVNGWFLQEKAPDDSGDAANRAAAREASIQTLARRLEDLATQPALARSMGENGLKKVRETYDWSRVYQQLESVYQSAEGHARQRYGTS